MAKAEKPQPASATAEATAILALLKQGWLSVAVWLSIGLLLEGLLGYKIPAYLNDAQRREFFRLAHAHGALLGALLIGAALTAQRYGLPPRLAQWALRSGTVALPLGFLLAGIWHPEGDPGLAIWLVPPAALLVIFGVIAWALRLWAKES